jgi:prepilin-type N-terminal cleavage/methylation domain-containing protein
MYIHSPGIKFARARRGFSLIELLTVMGFMSLLLAVTVPAINSLKGSGDFTRAVDEVELTLSRARTYAMARNTYVWVGFYEESGTGGSALPPYTGKGQVVIGVVASVDGTKIFEDDATAGALPDSRLKPVGRLQKISRVHLADVGAPSGTGDSHHLAGRPDVPYVGDDAESSRISSESAARTPFPFAMSGYTFYKTIRFSPSGEATINGAAVPKRLGEIGLVPAEGDRVATDAANSAAVQFSGIGGSVRTYRQ